jgi:hypothetical protein
MIGDSTFEYVTILRSHRYTVLSTGHTLMAFSPDLKKRHAEAKRNRGSYYALEANFTL